MSVPVGVGDWEAEAEADCVGLPEALIECCEGEGEAESEWLPVAESVCVGRNDRLGDRDEEREERLAQEAEGVSVGVGGGSDAVAVPVGVGLNDWDSEGALLWLK